MSLAPDWTVPPDVTPFQHLPVLDLCSHCRDAIPFLSAMQVWDGTTLHRPLCGTCARSTLTPDTTDTRHHAHP